MIQPATLQKNDTIAIIAPGKKLDREVVLASVRIIESWGFQVKLGKNLFSDKHSYMSGSDAERLEDFQSMLDDPSVQAILCARGGYGTTRILDQLNFDTFIKIPKWICGFSDITALHLKLQTLGVQSIHGTMPVMFPKSESASSVAALQKILTGEKIKLEGGTDPSNISGDAKGKVVGGNLSLIVDSLGTRSEIQTEDKILILEEFDEHFYRIDRMMVQLKRAEKLKNLAGLVIGQMNELKESEPPFGESYKSIVVNHVGELGYPVGFGFSIGHGNPNFPWIEGSDAILQVTKEKSVLSFN